jgi:hypothetical protein
MRLGMSEEIRQEMSEELRQGVRQVRDEGRTVYTKHTYLPKQSIYLNILPTETGHQESNLKAAIDSDGGYTSTF